MDRRDREDMVLGDLPAAEEIRVRAAERSRERAATNPSGIGAAYIGPAAHNLDA
jgi:hypothetical protein